MSPVAPLAENTLTVPMLEEVSGIGGTILLTPNDTIPGPEPASTWVRRLGPAASRFTIPP